MVSRPLLLVLVTMLTIHVEAATTGHRRVKRLILGKDLPKGHPSIGVLAYKNERSADRPYFVMCTMVLVDKYWAMTTAHCLDKSVTPLDPTRDLYIVFGLTDNSWNYNKDDVQEQRLKMKNVHEHPYFCAMFVMTNDITLVKVKKPFTLNDKVKPVDLPSDDMDYVESGTCQIIGWGVEKFPVTNDSFVRFMKKGAMKVVDCDTMFLELLSSAHLCAVGKGVKPCSGDSGAPLFCTIDGKKQLIGIDSFGRYDSCEKEPVQVFTRIRPYLEFIRDTMDKD